MNSASPAVGREAITELVQGFMSAFPNLQVLLNDVFLEGECAVYRWTLIGTNTGPGGTGNRVCISGFELWRIGEAGLIAESQGSFDSASYQHQLAHGTKAE